MTTHIVVIGAGDLGVTFALLLDHMRYRSGGTPDWHVTLIDRRRSILQGATRAAWIDHATGFEYFRPKHTLTGKTCIQGAITKRLFLPADLHDMPVPIRNRFFVSTDSHVQRRVPYEMFAKQASRNVTYYAGFIHRQAKRRDIASDTVYRLWREHAFGRELERHEYGGVPKYEVAGGFESAGGVANMAMDYALKKQALRLATSRGTIRELHFNVQTIDLEERDGGVTVWIDEKRIEADLVVSTAASGNSLIAKKAHGVDASGTYALNFMLYIDLPPTSDAALREVLASVNFVLQGSDGAMYACLVPPTAHDSGVAAVFHPDARGSHIDRFVTRRGAQPPDWWQEAIATSKFPSKEERVRNVLKRVYRFNPFLSGYIGGQRTVVGQVFNPSSPSNLEGRDDRVRVLQNPTLFTHAGRVVGMTTPKWTTDELAALTLINALLPNDGKLYSRPDGFGPAKLDVVRLASDLGSINIKFQRELALEYVRHLDLPDRIVPVSHPLFVATGDT